MVTDEPESRTDADDQGGAEVVELRDSVIPAPLANARPDRWMGPAAIGAAIVILVAGVILASRPDLAIVAASPSVSPSGSGQLSIASPSPSMSPRPTRFIALPRPCKPANWGDDTGLVAYAGFSTWQLPTQDFGAYEPGVPDDWTQTIAEVRANDPASAVRVAAGDELRVSTFGLSCVATASATFLRLDGTGVSTPISSGGTMAASASGRFVAPEPGDWLVRFVVGFAVPGETRWVEAFARLLVGAGAQPPRPEVLPNAPCGPADEPAEAALFLNEVAVPGSSTGRGELEPRTIPFGSLVEVRLAGDRCATTWVIQGVRRDAPGRDAATYEIAYRSATPDPAVASQNRFRLTPEQPLGTWDITATFAFQDGTTRTWTWAVTYEEIDVPPLIVAQQGGTTSVRAWIGCGVSIEGPGGGSYGGDGCASNLPSDPLERIVVPVGSRLAFDVPGWEIADWGAQAGKISGDPASFEWGDGGSLRGATSPPVDFPAPRAGSWALQLNATLIRSDGLRINGSWFALIDVR